MNSIGQFPPKTIQMKNGANLTLRGLEKRDLEGIWDNFNDVVREEVYLPVYTPVLNDWEKNSWFNDMTMGDNFCVVAVDRSKRRTGHVVGQVTIESLQWEAAEHVSQLGIIIKKEFRNAGLGYELIRYAQECAVARGKTKLILSTLETNQMGKALYEKCGFRVAGTYHGQYLIRDQCVDELLMEWFNQI